MPCSFSRFEHLQSFQIFFPINRHTLFPKPKKSSSCSASFRSFIDFCIFNFSCSRSEKKHVQSNKSFFLSFHVKHFQFYSFIEKYLVAVSSQWCRHNDSKVFALSLIFFYHHRQVLCLLCFPQVPLICPPLSFANSTFVCNCIYTPLR